MADVGRNAMNKKERIGQAFALIITAAAAYYGFIKHNMLAAGICFIAIGIINLLTRTIFTLLIMAGLFCVSLHYKCRMSHLIISFLLCVMASAQLYIARSLLGSQRSAGRSEKVFRMALWEHDIVIWLINRYKIHKE